jgi:hypothetical protein
MKYLTLLLAGLLLAGCTATGPIFNGVAKVNPDKAVAYFYRQAAFYGSGTCPDLVIDEEEIGCLKNGGYFEVTLEPGDHLVLFDKGTWEPYKDLRSIITLEAGTIYYFEYGQEMTGAFAVPGFAMVSGRENFHRKTEEYSLSILKKLKKS